MGPVQLLLLKILRKRKFFGFLICKITLIPQICTHLSEPRIATFDLTLKGFRNIVLFFNVSKQTILVSQFTFFWNYQTDHN